MYFNNFHSLAMPSNHYNFRAETLVPAGNHDTVAVKSTKRIAAAHKAWATRRAKVAANDHASSPHAKLAPAARVEARKLKLLVGLSEQKQVEMVMESWSNLGRIAFPCEKAQILAVAIDARAFALIRGNPSELVQTLMLRKNPRYIQKIDPAEIKEKAVLTVVKTDVSTICAIPEANRTDAVITASSVQLSKQIDYLYGKAVHRLMFSRKKLKNALRAYAAIGHLLTEEAIAKFKAVLPDLLAMTPEAFTGVEQIIPKDLIDDIADDIEDALNLDWSGAREVAKRFIDGHADEVQKFVLASKYDLEDHWRISTELN